MLTLAQFYFIVRRRRLLILLSTVAGLVAAIGWSGLTPRRYTASAQILVNVRAVETVGQPGSVADQLAPDYLSTQTDIIRSERILSEAARALGLDRDGPRIRALVWSPEAGPALRYAVKFLRGHVALSPSATSRMLDLRATAPDATLAAEIANAVADAYRDGSLAIQSEPARLAIRGYDRQATELRARWAAEQGRLAAKQRALGVTTREAGDDAETARLVSLSGQLAVAEAAQATAAARADRTALPDVIANPVVQDLEQRIAEAAAKRQQLAATAGPRNVDVREVTGQIEALRAQLAAQRGLIRDGVASAARQGASSVATLRAAVADQKQRVIAAQGHRGEISLIEQSLASIRQTYEQVMQRRAQLSVQDTVGQGNAIMLSRARPPETPSWPRPIVMAAIGLVAGLMAGVAGALAFAFARGRLDAPEDIELWSDVPFVGGIGLSGGHPALAAPRSLLTSRFGGSAS